MSNSTIALLLAAALATCPALADDRADQGKSGAAAPATASANRENAWKARLAKPSLAMATAFDGKGRLWLATIRGRHLYVSHSDDKGNTLSAPVKVNVEPEDILGDGENRPKIVVRKGTVYVSYTRGLEKPMTGDIRFSRSLDGGRSFSAPLTVNDNREIISHRFEAMGVNDRGEITLAWLDKRDLSAAERKRKKYIGAAVYYAVSKNGGASFEPNRKAADHACECCRVAMAMDKDDVPVIFWRHIYGKNVRDHALLGLDGKSQPARVSWDNWEVDACPHHGPAISIGADGVYHLAWFNNAPQRHGLFYAYSSDRGKSFSAPVSFGDYEAQASHPAVLGLGKSVFIAWKEFDGQNSTVNLMTSGDGGKSWSPPQKLAATSGASDHPLLIGDGNQPYLSWNILKEGFRLIEIKVKGGSRP